MSSTNTASIGISRPYTNVCYFNITSRSFARMRDPITLFVSGTKNQHPVNLIGLSRCGVALRAVSGDRASPATLLWIIGSVHLSLLAKHIEATLSVLPLVMHFSDGYGA